MISDRNSDGLLSAFLRYRGRMEQQILRRVGCRATAADLVQNLFMRLWRRPPDIQELTAAYLLTSARNIAIDHQRAAARSKNVDIELAADRPSEEVAADAALASRQELERVRAALRALPQRTREIFLLNRIHGQSYARIAATLGVSVSTVEKQMMRALAACRAAVEDTVVGNGPSP